jgi:hypothetical protein
MLLSLLSGIAQILNFIAAKLEDLADWISRRSPSSEYPMLPQNDPEISQRQAFLDNARQLYQYNYTYIESLPMVETVPTNDRFSLPWIILVLKTAVKLLRNNQAILSLSKNEKQTTETTQEDFSQRLLAASESRSESVLVELLADLPKALETQPTGLEGDRIEEYDNLFRIIPLPVISQNFTSNDEFARLRVAGFNPLVIQQDSFEVESFISNTSSNIILSAFKQSEDGLSWIVRFYESYGESVNESFTFANPIQSVYECDLLENPLSEVSHDLYQFSCKFTPFEIKTFAIAFNSSGK